jgi:hypothetical protein
MGEEYRLTESNRPDTHWHCITTEWDWSFECNLSAQQELRHSGFPTSISKLNSNSTSVLRLGRNLHVKNILFKIRANSESELARIMIWSDAQNVPSFRRWWFKILNETQFLFFLSNRRISAGITGKVKRMIDARAPDLNDSGHASSQAMYW